MRKKVINSDTINPWPRSQEEWLDLEEVARVEVTSEDPNFPIEAALGTGDDRAGGRPKRVSRPSASSLITRERCVGLDSSFPRQKLSEPRSSHFDGPMRRLDRSEKSCASSGSSVHEVAP